MDTLSYFEITIKRNKSVDENNIVNELFYLSDEKEKQIFLEKFNKRLIEYTEIATYHRVSRPKKNDDITIKKLLMYWVGELISIDEKTYSLKELAKSFINNDFDFINRFGEESKHKIKDYIFSFLP